MKKNEKNPEPFDPRWDEPRPEITKVELELPLGVTKEAFEKALKALTNKKEKSPAKTGGPIVFASIEKKPGTELRVSLDYYKGRELLSLREWWSTPEDPVLKPGKGATFDYEMIDELIAGLTKMKEYLDEHQEEKE
jgi:hypothetical protein